LESILKFHKLPLTTLISIWLLPCFAGIHLPEGTEKPSAGDVPPD